MSAETSVASVASGALTAADALPPIAISTTIAATADIPAAGLCLVQMLKGAGMPGGLGKAAQYWAEGAAKLDQAKQNLERVANTIPDDAWSSDDRKGFDGKVEEFGKQLETARVFCDVTATAMVVSGAAIAAFDAYIALIGAELLIQAMMIAAEAASVVGDLGPVEAQEAEANATAAEIAESLEGTNDTMKTVSQATAISLTVAAAAHTGIQMGEGNDNALGDALKGTAIAAPSLALTGLASASAGSLGGLGGKGFGAAGESLGKGVAAKLGAEEVGQELSGWAGSKAAGWVGGQVTAGLTGAVQEGVDNHDWNPIHMAEAGAEAAEKNAGNSVPGSAPDDKPYQQPDGENDN